MAQRRMACWNCPRYNRDERACRDGKANPKRKADSLEVAQLLGLRALCHYNPYRDGIAARMHFPKSPIAVTPPVIKPRRGDRTQKIEIEIEEQG